MLKETPIPFEIAKQKALDNWTDFSRQYLCEATYGTDDLPLFDLETLQRGLVHAAEVPSLVERFGIGDPAGSANARSDFSCLLKISRARDQEGVTHLYLEDFKLVKEKFADLAVTISMFYRDEYLSQRLSNVIIEKPSQHELFEAAIRESCRVRYPFGALPLWFHEIDNSKNAKATRIRNLSLLMGTPMQIHFVEAPWNKEAFEMLCSYSGKKSGVSEKSKDDFLDALALAASWLIQPTDRPAKQDTPEDQAETMRREWEANAMQRARAAHQAMFGATPSPAATEDAPPEPANIYQAAMQRTLGNSFR